MATSQVNYLNGMNGDITMLELTAMAASIREELSQFKLEWPIATIVLNGTSFTVKGEIGMRPNARREYVRISTNIPKLKLPTESLSGQFTMETDSEVEVRGYGFGHTVVLSVEERNLCLRDGMLALYWAIKEFRKESVASLIRNGFVLQSVENAAKAKEREAANMRRARTVIAPSGGENDW